jgi:hypothetical protein
MFAQMGLDLHVDSKAYGRPMPTTFQIDELTTLAADLQRAAATLSDTPVDGPCDDTCGCTTDTTPTPSGSVGTAVPLLAKPDAATPSDDVQPGDVPIACTLGAAEQGCCRFFDFAVAIDRRGVALEVHAPPDGQRVLTGLFGTPLLNLMDTPNPKPASVS